ncbi:MAG: NAD-dependent epimerase/dehydratase family protein [Myxococcota bacterium]
MRILVTGGAGFIGSHLADALLDRGHEVVLSDDLSTGRPENLPARADFVEGDFRDPAIVERLFSGRHFDAICHQGAQTSVSVSTREPVRDAEVNVVGSIRLLEAATAHEVPLFIFASTGGAIYGEVPEGTQASIETQPAPLSPYACSKLAFEHYLRAYVQTHDIQTRVLRYANVYGPRQDPHGEAGVVAIFCGRILSNAPIQVNAKSAKGDRGCVRDYVYIDDVVAANLAAVEGRMTAPLINVGTGIGTDTQQLAEVLLAKGKSQGSTSEMDFGDVRDGDLQRSVLQPSRIPGLESFVDIETGLARTYAWFEARAAALES